jgi:hypothetical protein
MGAAHTGEMPVVPRQTGGVPDAAARPGSQPWRRLPLLSCPGTALPRLNSAFVLAAAPELRLLLFAVRDSPCHHLSAGGRGPLKPPPRRCSVSRPPRRR